MSKRDRKLAAAETVAGSPDATGDTESVDLDAAEARELADHLADAPATETAEPVAAVAPRSDGLIVCRVHPFGSFNHDMVIYAPGEEALFSRAVIDANPGVLTPLE